MKHGYSCGCPDCEEAHPNAFDHVGEPKEPPMTRERLSEEEIGRISRSTPIPETLSVVEDILTARVTAARLAAEAAENEAAAACIEDLVIRDQHDGHEIPIGKLPALRIRSRLTAPRVSALDEERRRVREATMKKFIEGMQITFVDERGLEHVYPCECHKGMRILPPYQQPPITQTSSDTQSVNFAVPDGAAKGDGE